MSVSELRTAAAPKKIPTAAELVGLARTLAPKLRERALKAERDRNVPRKFGRGIYRGWPDPYPAAQALGRLRARPRSRVRHRHRARQVDLRLIGLGLELFRRSRLHSGPFPGRGAARRLESKTTPPASPRRLRRPARCSFIAPGGYRLDGRWSWCSGLSLIAMDHDRRVDLPRRRARITPTCGRVLVPVSQVKQDDTWYCAGLRASGSTTLGARQCVRAGAPHVSPFRPCATPALPGRIYSHQSDPPHAVHRRAQLCVALVRGPVRLRAATAILRDGCASAT